MSGEVRALDDRERAAFRLARLVSSERAPYFMHALFAAEPVAAPGLGTFAVDRHWRLYMDPELLTGRTAWDSTTAGAVLLHEVGHLIRDHAGRAAALTQPYVHLAWNLAGDAEINDDLLAAGVPLPAGVVRPADLGCEDGGLAEDYYATLLDDAHGGQDGGGDGGAGAAADDGGHGCGSGAGSPAVPGELAADADLADGSAPGIGEAEGDLVRRRVAIAVTDHVASKGRGSVPAGLDRWARRVLAPPVVPWPVVLRAAVRRAVSTQAGMVDQTYARPGRRQTPGIVTPAMVEPQVIVAVVIDTSGSMGQGDLDAAMSEVNGVLSANGVDRDHLHLLACDAEAATAQRVRSLADVKLVGGGGTDMRVGIAAAEALRPAPHVVVVLTDGDTPWPERRTRSRLVCGVVSARPPKGTPPWATTVAIPPLAA